MFVPPVVPMQGKVKPEEDKGVAKNERATHSAVQQCLALLPAFHYGLLRL